MRYSLAIIIWLACHSPAPASTLKEKAVSLAKVPCKAARCTYTGVRFVCAKTYDGACVVSKKLEPLVPLASVVGSSGPILYALLVPR